MTDSDRIERAASTPPLAVGGTDQAPDGTCLGPMGLGIFRVQRSRSHRSSSALTWSAGWWETPSRGGPEREHLAGYFDGDGGRSGRGDRAHHRPAGGCEAVTASAASPSWSGLVIAVMLGHVQRKERSQLPLDCAGPAGSRRCLSRVRRRLLQRDAAAGLHPGHDRTGVRVRLGNGLHRRHLLAVDLLRRIHRPGCRLVRGQLEPVVSISALSLFSRRSGSRSSRFRCSWLSRSHPPAPSADE